VKKILVVCTANICRSPYAAAALGARLSLMPGLPGIQISSAGTKALPGAGLCREVDRSLSGGEQVAGDRRGHTSSLVDPSAIESADLILVMELSQRSEVARISPSARRKTFTLLEAAELAQHAQLSPQTRFSDSDGSADVLFGDFVAELHSLRGLAPLRTGARTPLWKKLGRGGHDPLDIPDGHNSASRPHRATLKQVEEATLELAAALDRLFA
jgi:protein-tyrosine phosphatase